MIEWNEPNQADKKAVKEIAKSVSKDIVGQLIDAVKSLPDESRLKEDVAWTQLVEEEITRKWKEEKESGVYVDGSFDDFVTFQHIAWHFAEWGAEQLKSNH